MAEPPALCRMAGLDGGGDQVPELRNIRPKEAIAAPEGRSALAAKVPM